MIKKRPLNIHAQSALRELAEGHGIKCDLEETLWLDRLGENIDNPPGGSNLHLIGRPARCGNVILWPLTIGSSIWWRECGGVWFDDHNLEGMVFAYTLAHSREPEIFEASHNYDSTKKLVKRWSCKLGATAAELEHAFDVIGETMDTGEPPDDVTPKDDDGHVIGQSRGILLDAVAELSIAYGGGLAYWTWEIDRDTALHKLAMCRQIQKIRDPNATALPDPNNPEARAVKCRRVAVISIIKSRGFTLDDDGVATPPDGWKSEVE